MNYSICAESHFGICKADDKAITFTASRDADSCFFSMSIVFDHWDRAFYLLIPGCAYNGNRFQKVKRAYPPMYAPEETGPRCTPLMCDVPSLAPDGTGKMEVTTGDMAVPCVCLYNPEREQAFMLFTHQQVKGKNLGFTVEKERITICHPANRQAAYRFCTDYETNCDQGISVKQGEQITLEHKILTFSCKSITELFEMFFEKRKCLLSGCRPKNMYTKELWDMQERKFNKYNYSGKYYAEISKIWQCGWVGGAMSSYPLLMRGSSLSKQRAVQTLDYLFAHQAKSGFFYGFIENDVIGDDSFHTAGMEHVHLIRKSADVLYFLFKHFDIITPKPHWTAGTKKCADAFVKLFETYGTFGQFVNIETGELVVVCSTAGAMAIGGLVKAWEYFHEPGYLKTAKLACDFYYRRDVENGVTSGGPGEILCAPDSESCFAMLESCIVLYEATQEEKWLCYAKSCAHLAASWVVAYPYRFPCGSEFSRLRINTVGAVFANVQNKHAAPGICTLSGDSLLKLYRYTQNERYLDLIKDIAYCIPQCVSTDTKPLYSWSDPPEKLPEGFINERVNMSDWEGFDKVGGVFYGSCWCETSLLLTFCELMQHDEMKESI